MEYHANFAVKHPWATILATLLIALITWAGLSGIVERSDYKAFVDADYPGMVELEEIESIFGENNNVFITIAPNDGDIFTKKTLRIIQQLTDDAWQLPFSQRVDSLTNYQYTTVDGDELVVDDLVPDLEPITPAVIAKAKRVAPTEVPLHGLFVSSNLDVASVNITFQFAYERLLSDELGEAGRAVYKLLEDYQTRYPEIQFQASGSVAIDYVSDIYHAEVSHVLMPAMIAVMIILLMVTLKSIWATLCTAVVVVLTGSITMGIFGWFKLEIDGMSAIAPIVIMTLAVADSVHVNAGVLNAMSDGKDKISAILDSVKHNFTPVFLTSLTTVLGVITFTFTDFPPLKKLGLIIALGVTVALILSVTLLPALLAISPLKPLARNTRRNAIFVALGEWVIRHYKKILPLAIVISLGFSAFIPRLVINESMLLIFTESTEIHKAIKFISKNLSGSNSLDIAVLSDEPNAVTSPEVLRTIDAFGKWAKAQPEIKHVTSIANTMKSLNQNMHQDDMAWYTIPSDPELAAQYLLLYEMSLPYGLDLNNQINLDKSGTRVTVMMDDLSGAEAVAVKERIMLWFSEHSPNTRNIAGSMPALLAEISYKHLLPKMLLGGIIAIFTVSLVLFFALRSWRFGLLGMMTNIIPICIAYGIWAISHGFLTFAVASVAGVCLGVVVDFAVHFLNKFQYGLKTTGSAEGGVRYAFEKVASPLWTTMVVLASGFWVLTITPFGVVSDMGLLTGVVIVIALLFDLLALPAFLLYFGQRKESVSR